MSVATVTTPVVNLDPFLTVADLAAYTRVSVKTIYDWRLRDVAPIGTRLGRSLLFRQSDVETWLAAGRGEASRRSR